MVASVSPSCVNMAPIIAISSGLRPSAIAAASAVIVAISEFGHMCTPPGTVYVHEDTSASHRECDSANMAYDCQYYDT